MFAVLLNYTAPIEEIDAAIPDHVKWLDENYQSGHFLASGRRNPRTGGVILVRLMERVELDTILASDPFALRQLAHYEVIDFAPTKTAPELDFVNESLKS